MLTRGGELSHADYPRCKVRYFSDGAVLGGKEFVESIFQRCRERFVPKWKDGARRLQELEDGGGARRLFKISKLRKSVLPYG